MTDRPERYVTNKEMWNALDDDTKAFVEALASKQMVMKPASDAPNAPKVEVALSIRAIKTTELIWINKHRKCEAKK